MTDDSDQLERLLGGLSLRRPGTTLDGRIAASAARRSFQPARWAMAAGVLVAAGVAWHLGSRPAVVRPAVASVASPVSAERVVSRTVDDGEIVVVAGRGPCRRVREQTVRDVWWVDPATGARLYARLPSERVTVEPAETF